MDISTGLRRAALFGLIPVPAMCVALAVGHFPYPDMNVGVHAYTDYLLAHHTSELQVILGTTTISGIWTVVALLAVAHVRFAGRFTLESIVMIGGVTVFAVLQLACCCAYEALALTARGTGGFGARPADLGLARMMWALTNTFDTVALPPLAAALAAVYVANRRYPVLPVALGRVAAFIAPLNVVALGSIFIDSGPWSPGSTYTLVVSSGPVYLWTTVSAVFLLRGNSGQGIEAQSRPGPATTSPKNLEEKP